MPSVAQRKKSAHNKCHDDIHDQEDPREGGALEHFVLDSQETERLGTRTRWIPRNFNFFTGGAVVNDSGGAVVTPCPAPE